MKKFAIIGCGYVGSAAAKFFKSQGWHVSATTRFEHKIPKLSSYLDHVTLVENAPSILASADLILYCVAPDASSSYENTYLETAKKLFSPNKWNGHLIYTSSTSVYGDKKGSWVTEVTSCVPETEEAKILFETEQLLTISSPHLTLLRIGEIFGPGRTWEDKARRFAGKKLPGTGDSFLNITSLETIIEALLFAFDKKLYGIFNLVEDSHPSRKEWYNGLCKAFHLPDVVWDPTLPSAQRGNKRVSSQKIKDHGFFFHPDRTLPLSE